MNRFCTYLNKKCKESNNSIRRIATLSNISHPYLLDLMNGNKVPPDINTQINIANALELKPREKIKFFNLAAEERKEIPADIYQAILEDKEKWDILRVEIGEKIDV